MQRGGKAFLGHEFEFLEDLLPNTCKQLNRGQTWRNKIYSFLYYKDPGCIQEHHTELQSISKIQPSLFISTKSPQYQNTRHIAGDFTFATKHAKQHCKTWIHWAQFEAYNEMQRVPFSNVAVWLWARVMIVRINCSNSLHVIHCSNKTAWQRQGLHIIVI